MGLLTGKLKYLVHEILYLSPVKNHLRKRMKNSVLSIAYHDVGTEADKLFGNKYSLSLAAECFEEQVVWLKNNYNMILPDNIDIEKKDYSKPDVVITFDDGYFGVLKNAVPILNKHKVPAVIFINSKYLEDNDYPLAVKLFWLYENNREIWNELNKNGSGSEINLSSPEAETMINSHVDIAELKNYVSRVMGNEPLFLRREDLELITGKYSDIILIGNHSHSHYNMILLDEPAVIDELEKVERELPGYSHVRKMFSIPFGMKEHHYSDDIVRILESKGYRYIFSNDGGLNLKHEMVKGNVLVIDRQLPPRHRFEKIFCNLIENVSVNNILRILSNDMKSIRR